MRVAMLLLHLPQALQTAEQVAAPQHEAATLMSWLRVACQREMHLLDVE